MHLYILWVQKLIRYVAYIIWIHDPISLLGSYEAAVYWKFFSPMRLAINRILKETIIIDGGSIGRAPVSLWSPDLTAIENRPDGKSGENTGMLYENTQRIIKPNGARVDQMILFSSLKPSSNLAFHHASLISHRYQTKMDEITNQANRFFKVAIALSKYLQLPKLSWGEKPCERKNGFMQVFQTPGPAKPILDIATLVPLILESFSRAPQVCFSICTYVARKTHSPSHGQVTFGTARHHPVIGGIGRREKSNWWLTFFDKI